MSWVLSHVWLPEEKKRQRDSTSSFRFDGSSHSNYLPHLDFMWLRAHGFPPSILSPIILWSSCNRTFFFDKHFKGVYHCSHIWHLFRNLTLFLKFISRSAPDTSFLLPCYQLSHWNDNIISKPAAPCLTLITVFKTAMATMSPLPGMGPGCWVVARGSSLWGHP